VKEMKAIIKDYQVNNGPVFDNIYDGINYWTEQGGKLSIRLGTGKKIDLIKEPNRIIVKTED
jgi:hypothetical protein